MLLFFITEVALFPKIASTPREAFHITKRYGAALLKLNSYNSESVLDTAREFIGPSLLALHKPKFIGSEDNAVGREESKITVPHHCDSIGEYRSYVNDSVYVEEAPDYMILCGNNPDSDGGGETFLADLKVAMDRMPYYYKKHLYDMNIVNNGKLERLVISNPKNPVHTCHRIGQGIMNSFSKNATRELIYNTEVVPKWKYDPKSSSIQPSPYSKNPLKDMNAIEEYLNSIAYVSSVSRRFLLTPGMCVTIDNFRITHGREPFSDPTRSLWQVWLWSNESISTPSNAGEGRAWA
tara:strand:+ start:388 stop:1269 length:882 start_codon:yes stop_codon:yes gene_type:complete